VNSLNLLIVLHLAATFGMTGLIWFVQIVHYPMMGKYREEDFAAIEKEHCDRTGFVVAPLMLGEVATAAALFPAFGHQPLFLAGVVLLCVIWASTFLLQVPAHRKLLNGRDGAALGRLTSTNWIRTLAWTGRSILLVLLFS